MNAENKAFHFYLLMMLTSLLLTLKIVFPSEGHVIVVAHHIEKPKDSAGKQLKPAPGRVLPTPENPTPGLSFYHNAPPNYQPPKPGMKRPPGANPLAQPPHRPYKAHPPHPGHKPKPPQQPKPFFPKEPQGKPHQGKPPQYTPTSKALPPL